MQNLTYEERIIQFYKNIVDLNNYKNRFRVIYGTQSYNESKSSIFFDTCNEAMHIAIGLCNEHEFVRVKDNLTLETLFNKKIERNEDVF